MYVEVTVQLPGDALVLLLGEGDALVLLLGEGDGDVLVLLGEGDALVLLGDGDGDGTSPAVTGQLTGTAPDGHSSALPVVTLTSVWLVVTHPDRLALPVAAGAVTAVT